MTATRREYFTPDEVFKTVQSKIDEVCSLGEKIDYLTFVPDGEPTLDIHLGQSIVKLKTLGYKIAVISNSSLLANESVRSDLMCADWVSLKIDSVLPEVWKKINRPHGSLELKDILKGIEQFASVYQGVFVSETMLVKNINDTEASMRATAEVVQQLHPRKAYVLIPTRPPAESSVAPPDETALASAYQIFTEHGIDTEFLVYSEGDDFTYGSDVVKALLDILSVHPMRKDAVQKFLSRSRSERDILEHLLRDNRIHEIIYNNNSFIVRTIAAVHNT
jgi:wyosine [tRNA(Phe)-imidazoG37] synthetase (radical SAM superfamily)